MVLYQVFSRWETEARPAWDVCSQEPMETPLIKMIPNASSAMREKPRAKIRITTVEYWYLYQLPSESGCEAQIVVL
jgi:hypothetical protein